MRLDDQKIIFIVGNSRSGTKMLTTILNKNPNIFCFPEMHFFEQFYDFSDKSLNPKEALEMLTTLLCIGEKGYRGNAKLTAEEKKFYSEKSEEIIEMKASYHPVEIYFMALRYYGGLNFLCDPTPRNQFYVEEISRLIKNAKFLYLIRDPRDILLS